MPLYFYWGLTSCENFFNGSELRAEIENHVAYANALAYTIRVDYPENSGIVKSPAAVRSPKKCTFKKAPSDGMKLCLVPELAERPQIISCSPTSSGMIKNSVIQVLFDRKMDPGSIYYTAPEIKSLKESGVHERKEDLFREGRD